MTEPALAPRPTLPQLFWGMLQVALSSFGGGLSAWSQRIVVEQRRWMTNEQFLTGLTVARLFPGPNQINMAVYIGADFHGLAGALVALAGMLLLPFTLLMALGLAYFQFHTLPAVDRVLAGVVAAGGLPAAGIQRGGGPVLLLKPPGGDGVPAPAPFRAAGFSWRPDRPVPRGTWPVLAPASA